uniref:DNA helicase n=1 Tax=Tanacetum cinerariifolium TaxID=118510 RepID=A0A6L2J1H0_TANCI|nr:DNA helicase [Tanacetum cinerariifolium]
MAAFKYKEEHNKVGYLLKRTGSDDYCQIIDFFSASHLMYALTSNPIIFDSLVKQFWSTATHRAPELGPPAILVTIDKTPYTITEELVRSRRQLDDDGGVADLPIPKIYFGMDNLGYVTEGKLTFFKNKFSPQWRGMVNNIGNAKKFLMYPRFLQTILGIETRVTRQYNVLAFSNKLFVNMRLKFVRHPMPLLSAMLLQAQVGGGAEVAKQAVTYPMSSPDNSLAHLPTPSRPHISDPVAPVLEHDHCSDQHETADGSFLSRDDVHLGGNFHLSPPWSSHDPLAGQPSGGEEDPITLTALSFVVSTLMQKVKLKMKKRKLVVSDSNPEDSTTQDMDLDALRALANAAVAADSDIPSGNTSQLPTASPCALTAGPLGTSDVPSAHSAIPPGASGVSSGPFVTPTTASAVPADIPKVPVDVPADSPNREEDRLGEEAAKRLHKEEMAEMERESAEAQRKRQQDVLESAKFYNVDDWLNIRAQVEANVSLSKTLLGDDVTEDNFPAHMSSAIYTTGWTMAYVKSFSDEQLLQEFEKIRKTFLKFVIDEDSDDEDSIDEVWSGVVGWEVLSTPLGEINALYRIDRVIFKFCLILRQGERVLVFGKIKEELASPEQTATSKDISNSLMAVMICQKSLGYSNSPMIHVLRVGLVINPSGYIVPTGRVIVPTGRRLVPKSVGISSGPLPVEHSVVAQGCGLLTIHSHKPSVRLMVLTLCFRQLDGSLDVFRLNELQWNVINQDDLNPINVNTFSTPIYDHDDHGHNGVYGGAERILFSDKGFQYLVTSLDSRLASAVNTNTLQRRNRQSPTVNTCTSRQQPPASRPTSDYRYLRVDDLINNGHGPYVFKISGKLYHWIGSLCRIECEPPRIACEKFQDTHVPNFKVRLYNVVGAREYELPTGDMLGAIVYETGPESDMDYDIELEERSVPCGLACPSASCMHNIPWCKKNFPKEYCQRTYIGKNGFVHYKRRNTDVITTRQNIKLDNSYVVPYNKKLMMTFYAHINVEYCEWSMLIKYLFKYISKGTNRVVARISRNGINVSEPEASTTTYRPHVVVDKIKNYLDARYISPHEACRRIFKFDIQYRELAIQILSVQLMNMKRVIFREQDILDSIVVDTYKKKTHLTEWLLYNEWNTDGTHLHIWISYLNLFGTRMASIGDDVVLEPNRQLVG